MSKAMRRSQSALAVLGLALMVSFGAGGIARGVREHRARVRTARLVGAAPAHDLGELGLGRVAIADREAQVGAQHHMIGTHRRVPVAEVERRRLHLLILTAGQVEDADPLERRGHVGTVAVGVHPDPAAKRTRLPHLPPFAGPGEPVTSGLNASGPGESRAP